MTHVCVCVCVKIRCIIINEEQNPRILLMEMPRPKTFGHFPGLAALTLPLPWVSLIVKGPGNRIINSTPRAQNDCKIADDNLKREFVNETCLVSILLSLKSVTWGMVDDESALDYIMAGCRTGDKPLSKSLMTQYSDAYMWHKGEMSFNADLCQSCERPVDFCIYCVLFCVMF